MPDTALRQRLDAAIDVLDDAQRQRLLDWAGSMNRERRASARAWCQHRPHRGGAAHRERRRGGRACALSPRRRAGMLNPHGVLHGGAVYTMVDYAWAGRRCRRCRRARSVRRSRSKSATWRACAAGGSTARREIIKRGRQVVFLESRVTDDDGQAGRDRDRIVRSHPSRRVTASRLREGAING